MKSEYVLNLMTAIDWWGRPDLGPKPENAKRVAEVLLEAGVKVYIRFLIFGYPIFGKRARKEFAGENSRKLNCTTYS